MKKYLLLTLLLPFFSIAQQCDLLTTVIPNNNANSIVYCVTNTTCHDVCDGIISITVDGANQPYSYTWSIDGNTFLGGTIQDTLCPGDYIITITDVNGALVDNSHINTVQGPPNFSVFTNALNNPSCFNYNDGSIDLTINGATPFDPDGIVGSGDEFYTYLWEEGTATEDRFSLDSGLYILSMTDANDCNRIDSFELFNPAEVISETITDTLSCIGLCDGEAIVTPADGIAPYTYLWSNGDTDSIGSGLCYGTNTVTITDVNDCVATNLVDIANPDTLQLSNITIDSACYQICDGQLSVTIEGGIAPYDTEWSLGGNIFDTINTTTEDTLCPGNYQIKFTDANECLDSVVIPLIERDSFVVQNWIINDSCYNSCTGQIKVQLLNQENPPFTYSWDNGGTDTVISNLCSDTFELVIIDARLCRDTFEFFVDEPDSLFYDTIIVTNNLCYGDTNGAITIENLTGGVVPITYSWSNGDTSTVPGIPSLLAGMYSVHIEDANECAIDIANIDVTESDILYVFYEIVDDSCAGYSDGSITVSISGGTGLGTYKLNNVILTGNDTIISNLSAGQYLYTILDSNNCARPQDTILVEEPDVLEIDTAMITNVLCHGWNTAAIDLTVIGGSQPYDFQWTGPGGPYTTADLNNIGAGNYFIDILDLNLCPLSLSYNITEPSTPIMADLDIASVILCNGGDGDINLNVSGGTPSYTFQWSNASTDEDLLNIGSGTYEVTILDATGVCDTTATITLTEPTEISQSPLPFPIITDLQCYQDGAGSIDLLIIGGTPQYSFLWDNGETTEDINNLSAGTYVITVTDDNGCPYIESFIVEEPDLLEVSYDEDHVDCYGNSTGEIDITVIGGTTSYTYAWSNLTSNDDLLNIPSGTYDVMITDAHNCKDSASVNINEPTEIIFTVNSIDLICNNEFEGEILIDGFGGTPGYSYSIDGEATYSNGSDFLNLQAANYSVWIKDANGCKKNESVVLNQPIGYSSTFSTNNIVGCNGDATGSIILLTISGNTSPYSYSWIGNNQSTSSVYNLLSGDHEVVVSDANNCEMTYSFLITEPEAISLDYDIQLTSCEEKNDGSITTMVIGGTAPYYYLWGTGETTAEISYLSKGQYSLSVSDSKGCTVPIEYFDVSFDGFNGCVEIPSGFTPNNDNIHDEWVIYGLSDFPDVVVKIYNRWGQEIYSSQGYYKPWDGKYNGVDLPTAAYYYVIELNESDKVFNGTVTIKR